MADRLARSEAMNVTGNSPDTSLSQREISCAPLS